MKMEVKGWLEFDEDLMYGDDEEAFEWFMDMLLGGSNYLSNFGDLGDLIGEFKVVEVKHDK